MVEVFHQSMAVQFQGKDDREKFQFYFRQHWIRLLYPFIRSIVWNIVFVSIAVILFGWIQIEDVVARRVILLILVSAILYTNLEFQHRWFCYFLYVIIVTDKKVHRIKKTLICCNDHQCIDLWMLQDIHQIQHGFIQNIFNYGSIVLEAQETVLRLHYIPRVQEKCEEFLRLKEVARENYNIGVVPGR